MEPTTPTIITPRLIALAEEMQAKPPVFVSVKPEAGALKGDCFKNSERYCKENEGAVRVFGFLLRTNGVWAEAEYHAVVRLPTGELLDPTPEGKDRILFAEIEGERYRATGVFAIALIKYPVVTDFVAIQNAAHKALEKAAIYDSKMVRRNEQSPELEALMLKQDAAYKEVCKSFRNRWPTF